MSASGQVKVLLPTTVPLSEDLPGGAVATSYDVSRPIPAEHRDAEVLVAWGNPQDRLVEAAGDLARLRWVQGLAAGPDQLLAAGFAPEVVLTSGRSLHDRPVAEHTLALVLAAARRLDLTVRAQQEHRWAEELGGLQTGGNGERFTTLRDAHVVIWGFGSIAATLAPLLTALGARVSGIARTPGVRSGARVVTAAELSEVLPDAEVLVVLLPAVPATRRVVDARVLSLLGPRSWVVNVGRGSTVDEEALVAALGEGRLGGAALDVTATEPLPADSPLWEAPNLILTPHAAGGRPENPDGLIAENLAAWLAGSDLRNPVER